MKTSVCLMNTKLRERGVIRKPDFLGKDFVSVNTALAPDVERYIEKLALARHCRVSSVVEFIILTFKPGYKDVLFFSKGKYEEDALDVLYRKVVNFFIKPKPKVYSTFQVSRKSFDRLNNVQSFYGIKRSQVLKHILEEYYEKNH